MLLVIVTVMGLNRCAGTILDPTTVQDHILEQPIDEKPVESQKDVKVSKKELLEKDRLEKKKMLEEKAVKYFRDIGIEGQHPECNKNLLTLFGVTSQIDKPLYSTAEEKKYCRRNEVTCCSHADVENTRKHYSKGVSEMRKTLEMLEELFIMFKGPAFDVIIEKVKNVEATKCDYVFDELHIIKSEFVNPTKLAERTDILGSLLVDLEIYVKRQQWFFANTICTICNPLNHKHFDLGEKTTITTHVSTCSEVLEIKDFEIRVAEIFDSFINPYLNLVQCVEYYKENDSTEEETNSEELKKEDDANNPIKGEMEVDKGTESIIRQDELVQSLKTVKDTSTPLLQTQKTILEKNLGHQDNMNEVRIDGTIKDIQHEDQNQLANHEIINLLLEPEKSINKVKDEIIPNLNQQDHYEKPLDVKATIKDAVEIEKSIEDKRTVDDNMNKLPEKNDEPSLLKKKKRPELIKSLEMKEIRELKIIVTKCYHQKFNVKNEECMDICKKDFNSFKFPILFFDKVGEALKIIFKSLTEKDINEFYLNTKEREFKEADNDKNIEFYNFDKELYEKFHFDAIVWNYRNDDGIAIFTDHMSKKYVNKHVSAILVSIWVMFKVFL